MRAPSGNWQTEKKDIRKGGKVAVSFAFQVQSKYLSRNELEME